MTVLTFTPSELKIIRLSVIQNHALRVLDPYVCATVRQQGLNKRRKRGKRGGREARKLHTPVPQNNLKATDFKFLLLKARSVRAREFLIRDEIDSSNVEFAVITETWLRSQDKEWVECSQFNTDGYKILNYNGQCRKGGGLALVYKDKYIVETLEKGQKKSFEYLICSIRIRGTAVTSVIIYHPPYSGVNRVTVPTFIDEFIQFLPNIIINYKNTLILGDFNLHLDTDDPNAGVFADALEAMGLIGHVTLPTHIAGHTLDQIYSVLESPVKVNNIGQGPLISDHHIIYGYVSIPKNAVVTRSVKLRKFKDIDITALMHDFIPENISATDINEAVTTFDTELTRILDKHAPIKDRKVTDRKKEPWFEEHIKLQKKFVRNRESIWRKYHKKYQHQLIGKTIAARLP